MILLTLCGATATRLGAADLSAPGQVITVTASSSRAHTAVVRLWQRVGSGRFVEVRGPIAAFVGWRGVGVTREGIGRTPAGVFTLTQAFGNQPNPGTRLRYFRAGPDDWWDENPRSAHYNRHVRSDSSPGGDSENLYDAGYAYSHAIVINYNDNPVVRGAGSGIFLHVSGGRPTLGCVAIPAAALVMVLHWLDPARHPVISIGVGARSFAPLGTAR